MLRKCSLLAVLLGAVLATSLSGATVGLWSTGVCSGQNTNLANCQGGSGSLLNIGVNDNNYQVVSSGGISGISTGINSMLTESAISTYLPDAIGASEWLTPGTTAGGVFATGTYSVQTTFDLTGFVASTLSLFLDIGADNDVVAQLNGNTILSCLTGGTTCYSGWTSNHSIAAGGFALAGLNTLSFTVTNEDNPSPTALRVQVQGNADLAPVPEPATWALLGAGLAGLGIFRRRKNA